MKDLLQLAVFGGFLASQLAFARFEEFAGRKEWKVPKRVHFLVWLMHPHVLRAEHDFVIYIIGIIHG